MSRIDDSNSATGPASLGKKYALVVGVNESAGVLSLSPLKYAETDAQKIYLHLNHQVCNFAFSPQSYLVGNSATTQRVQEAVANLISQCTREDLLLFYFIGHGYPVRINGGDHDDFYLVTADFNPNTAKYVPTAHLSLSWIRNILIENDAPSIGHIIVVLDCCYSGNVLNQLRRYSEGSQNSGQAHTQHDRMRTIITSTGANRVAYEDAISGHARMTGLILKALSGQDEAAFRNRKVTLYSLYEYVDEQMELLIPLQRLHMWQNFLRRVVLADYSTQEPLKTSDDPFRSSAPTPPGQQFFDETTCQSATFANLDIEQVRAFLQKDLVRLQDDYRAGLSEEEQMKELGLLRGEHPCYGALLCLSRHPSSHQIAGAYTRCIEWRDTERLNGWNVEKEYRGSLLQQFAGGCDFLKERLGEHISEKKISEQDPPEPNKLPYRVLQEALANALTHREYVTEPDRKPRSEGVLVEIFSDRIEISSPGKSLVSLESLREADKKHPGSHPRNPQITRIFYLAGHVERVGSGVERIQKWTCEASLSKPRIDFNPHQQTLTVVLYRPGEPSLPPMPEDAKTLLIVEPSVLPMREEAKILLSEGSKEAFPAEVQIEPVSTGGPELEEVDIPMLPPKKSPWFRRPHYLIPVFLFIAALFWGLVPGLSYLHNLTLLPASTTIKIASDFPTSGLDTTSGLPQQNGVQMAIDEANNNQVLAGYTLKLVPYDDVGRDNRHDPQLGANNLKKAIADDLVAGIIGPYNSDVAKAELPIANQAPIALISPSTTYPCLTKSLTDDPDCTGSDNIQTQMRPTGQLTFFRLATPDDLESKAAADYLFKKGYRKVVLLKDDSDTYSSGYSLPFAHEWQHLGGQCLPLDLPQKASTAQDYQATLQAAVSSQPDLIYFVGNDPNGIYVLNAIAKIPALKTVAFAGAGGIVEDGFLQAAAQVHPSAPVYASTPILDPAHSGVAAGGDFQSDYGTSGYSDYRPYAASAYDSTKMLIEAIREALQTKGVSTPHGTQDQTGAVQFRKAILQTMARLSYTGVTGKHSFDHNGDTTNHGVSFYQLDFSTGQPQWQWLDPERVHA
jgi:branched-chain amino acid transport system substrate-binding protein